MTSSRKYAEIAAAALGKVLPHGTDSNAVADIVESVLADATREYKEGEQQHVAKVAAAAEMRLARLLDASRAVIYSFKAKDDFALRGTAQGLSEAVSDHAPADAPQRP